MGVNWVSELGKAEASVVESYRRRGESFMSAEIHR